MLKKNKMYLVFLSPVVITFIVVYLYPVIKTIQMSFYRIPGMAASKQQWELVGFQNYIDLFSKKLFIISWKNELLIMFVGGIIVFTISLFFAWVLHKGMRMGQFWLNMIYLPTIITPVAIVVVWTQYAFNSQFGLLKTIFEKIGMENLAKIPWNSPQYAFFAMLIAYCFGMIGGNLIVYMAAMKKIPNEIYEASIIDGATEGTIFFKITLPLIKDNIKTQLIFWCIGSIGFFLWSRVFSMVPSDPSTITPASYMYDLLFGSSLNANVSTSDLNVGMGTAIGVLLCLATMLIFGIINKLFGKEKYEM